MMAAKMAAKNAVQPISPVLVFVFIGSPIAEILPKRATTVHSGFFQIDSIIGPDGTQAHGMFFKLGNNPIKPGESRRVVCSFHCRPSFDAFMEAKRIYIWDGRIIGQVTLANEKNSN
jgi:hypothetical protein